MAIKKIRVAEMFAGVGGFRLGLEKHTSLGIDGENPLYETVWANQWEPPGTAVKQFAWRCYETRFGEGSCVNRDIADVLDDAESGVLEIPDFDLLVGSTPCQSFSVARPLSMSDGIDGDKGRLWWQFHRMLALKKPRCFVLENVDRMLSSPSVCKGRDFAIMLGSLCELGYSTEWRIVNAADYGFPQKRKRVFLFGEKSSQIFDSTCVGLGVLNEAFPGVSDGESLEKFTVSTGTGWRERVFAEFAECSEWFQRVSPFQTAGFCKSDGSAVSFKYVPAYSGPFQALGDVLIPALDEEETLAVPDCDIHRWEYLKGAKKEERVSKDGYHYMYSEGAMPFPDDKTKPGRTLLTSEWGRYPSRTRHVVLREDGSSFRRLGVEEMELLQGFPAGWTDGCGMTDAQRAFCMGNALVVGCVSRIGGAVAANVFNIGKEASSNG